VEFQSLVKGPASKDAIAIKPILEAEGESDPREMMFELELLMHHHSELLNFDNPFTHQEIYDIVKELPSNKFPGPDGFNEDFLRSVALSRQIL
jgi:hypothetical protein